MVEQTIDTLEDSDEPSQRLARYKQEIAYYEKEASAWHDRVRRILRRYKDERSPRELKNSKFNILYSNIQTLMPAIYGRNPKPDIERRFRDDDDLGRIASDILERCAAYFIDKNDFRQAMRSALFDRLTGGRGVTWNRYVPHFKPMELETAQVTVEENELGPQITQDEDEEAVSDEVVDGEPQEEVSFEEVATDYVHWEDYGHNWARTPDEIYLKWRRVYLTRKELVARFGEEKSEEIPLDYAPKGLADQKKDTSVKKAVIYELWDDTEKRVAWVHKDVDSLLDDMEDPLKLEGFWPCNEMYGILANDTMIPVPDYSEYQDQAQELDEITGRISAITRAIKVAGIYDASAPAIERLLSEGVENKLIPVEQWAVFGEKGGLKGAMDLLPMQEIAQTLLALYDARERVKNDLYEITGISDIIRGATKVETATAQQIKSQFTTLRLSDSQDAFASFSRDVIRNICIIIANHFSLETIKQISGVKLLTAQEKQLIQAQQQASQSKYQAVMQNYQAQKQANPNLQPPPAPPPISDDLQELLESPTWEEIEALFHDNAALSFKIDIEAESTIKMDQEADKEARTEFLKAAATFIGQAGQIGQQVPALTPLLGHMLLFGVRGFKIGKELEGQFKIAIDKMEKMAANPQQQQNPEAVKVQGELALKKAELDMKLDEMQREAEMQRANDERDAQREDMRAQKEAALKEKEMMLEFQLKEKEMLMNADLDMKKHQMTTEAQSKPVIQFDTGKAMDEAGQHIKMMAEGLHNAHQSLIQNATQSHGALINAANTLAKAAQVMHEKATKPKTVTMKAHDGRTIQAVVQ